MTQELDPIDKERFNMLYQQIIEIACGNFMYRQEPTKQRDHIDTMAVLLNMMSEEIYHFCFETDRKDENQHLIFSIFLDENLNIISFTPRIKEILKWDENILNMPISGILSDNSKDILKKHLRSPDIELNDNIYTLDFLTANNSYYRSHCSLQRIKGSKIDEEYLITGVKTIYRYDQKEKEKEANNQKLGSSKTENITTILLLKKVRLYILRNLHTTLPSLKELGLIHRTNKTKLKEGFKEMYGTTIHRFHMEKRLEKAGLLLRNTELPISEITQKCGFKDHSHFSKNFKLKFRQTPSQHRGENFASNS